MPETSKTLVRARFLDELGIEHRVSLGLSVHNGKQSLSVLVYPSEYPVVAIGRLKGMRVWFVRPDGETTQECAFVSLQFIRLDHHDQVTSPPT